MSDDSVLTLDVKPLDGADQWIAAIAKRAKHGEEAIRAELARQQVRPPAGWGARHHLRLEGMLFAGVKTPSCAPREPYVFDVQFRAGVTAFGTHGENDAGKSTVIRTIRWGLRGRCELQGDVRQWMRAVLVEFRVDDERLAVAFAVDSGEPSGAIFRLHNPISYPMLRERINGPTQALRDIDPDAVEHEPNSTQRTAVFAAVHAYLTEANAVEVAPFASAVDFERVMDATMLDRLGFARLPTWQQRKEEAQAHHGDGVLGELGWPTWSGALTITDPSVSVVLGEEKFAVVRLLQMYLGSPWATTVAALSARKGQLGSQIGAHRRRLQDQQSANSGDVTALHARLAQVDQDLRDLPNPIDLEDLDRRMHAVIEASERAAETEEAYHAAARAYGDTCRLLEAAEADVAALQEARLTRRFWHALKPTCCPRCDSDVTAERWAQERAGQCSLCSNPLKLDDEETQTEPEDAVEPDSGTLAALLSTDDLDIDSLDELTVAHLQVRQLQLRLAADDVVHDAANRAREHARHRWQLAQQDARQREPGSIARLQALHEERAALRARIDERSNARPTADLEEHIALLERQQAIISAAEAEAKKHLGADQSQLLDRVNQQVGDLGKKLGIRQLAKVTLQGNGHMPVVKGGPQENFGDLENGEKLRLKIALMVALMRVGEEAGVARHPGLILIDSLGREELNRQNMIDMLRELARLTKEVPHLQIVLTSAYGDVLTEGLGTDHVQLAPPGKPLW